MKKARKIVIVILVIAMIGTLIPALAGIFGSKKDISSNNPTNKKSDLNYINLSNNKDILKPLKTYINALYYHNGDYSVYKSVLVSPDKALDKASFEDVVKNTTVNDYFKYDAGSIETLIKHFVAVKKDDKIIVYYLKDIKSTDEMTSAKFWTMVKKSGVWLIEN